MSGRGGILGTLLGKKGEKNLKTLCVRPPYCNDSALFEERCVTCQDTPCVNACPTEIILLDAAHTPCLDFAKGGCSFCEACAQACPKDVLNAQTGTKALPIRAKIDILACMAWHQSLCNSCLDGCDVRAIRFLGLFRPTIDAAACNGCGGCVKVCPCEAIVMQAKEEA